MKKTEIISRHLTYRGALRKAAELNESQRFKGRSSGWKRIDYSVIRTNGLRGHAVIARHV